MSLALCYRPRRFEDLVGQRAVQVFLREMCLKDDLPAAMIFDGCRGTGKTTAARIVAAARNCEVQPGPCGHCNGCTAVFTGRSHNLIEIDAASHGLVDDIRRLLDQIRYAATGHRVVMLDEAHMMSTAAFNALLKTLEEPPANLTFILLTTEPRRIPETVQSRCTPFNFRRIGIADLVWRLDHICVSEKLDVEPSLLTAIADRADGSMRDAIITLDQVTRVGVRTAEQYTDLLGDVDFAPPLLTAMLDADVPAVFGLLREQMNRTGDATDITDSVTDLLRDLLILGSGGTITKQGPALEQRQRLAHRIPTPAVVTASKVLWDLATKVQTSPQAALDLAAVMLTEILGKLSAATAQPTTARKLTLAEMAATR